MFSKIKLLKHKQIKLCLINILCTLLIYKGERGFCDLGQVLDKVIFDLSINNFHDKLLYIDYGQINRVGLIFKEIRPPK